MATRRSPKSAPEAEVNLASDPLTPSEELHKLWLRTKSDEIKLLILANPNLGMDEKTLREKLSINQHGTLDALMPIAWFDTFFDNVSLPLTLMKADQQLLWFIVELAALRVARLAVATWTDYGDSDSSKCNIARVIYEAPLAFATKDDVKKSAFDQAYEVIHNGGKHFKTKERPFIMVRKLGWCFKESAEDGDGASLPALARLMLIYNRMMETSEFQVVSRRFPKPTFLNLL